MPPLCVVNCVEALQMWPSSREYVSPIDKRPMTPAPPLTVSESAAGWEDWVNQKKRQDRFHRQVVRSTKVYERNPRQTYMGGRHRKGHGDDYADAINLDWQML